MTLLTEPTRIVLAKGYSLPDDADAVAYIAAVEAADGQALETATRMAINSFVKGCKQDGIWTAIKASCILSGARTRLGALTPLVGTAPTSFNFVDGDYNRKTGLVGDGSTKYLNTNRSNNADPQYNHSQGVFVHTAQTSGSAGYIGVATGAMVGATHIGVSYSSSTAFFRSRAITASTSSGLQGSTGLLGTTRSSGSSFTFRIASASTTSNTASQTSASGNVYVFARNVFDGVDVPTNGRLQFYWIGESLDLALLDARVTDLINAFAAAIP